VDEHMFMVTKMMREEDDVASKVINTYNIGNHFRGYHGIMSAK